MNIRYALTAFVLLAAAMQATAKDPQPRGEAVSVQTVTFTVEAVDQQTREVTLKDSEGRLRTVYAGPRVKNLAQVRKGDVVTVSYMEAIALELKKGASGARAAVVEQAQGAAPGSKPGGVASREITLVATVVGVDPGAGMVTLKGPEGNIVNLVVRDRSKLKSVQVGDEVEAIYTEAIAVAVTPPRKK
jgi:Cu/Ag efflux protein CusF